MGQHNSGFEHALNLCRGGGGVKIPGACAGRRHLEVGDHLTLAARGKGYATEAARACLRHAFEALGAEQVVSIVDVRNEGSRRVAERVHARRLDGFEKYGHPIHLFATDRGDVE